MSDSRIASLERGEIQDQKHHNTAPALLYEESVLFDGGKVVSSGGLAATSGEKTGRSPKDKRIVNQAQYF